MTNNINIDDIIKTFIYRNFHYLIPYCIIFLVLFIIVIIINIINLILLILMFKNKNNIP